MNSVMFILGIIFVFSGTIVGTIIAHHTKRELAQGAPYMRGLQKALLVIFLLIPTLFGLSYGYLLLGLLIAMAFVGLIMLSRVDVFAYSMFAILLPYSSVQPVFFAAMCFVGFLFGLPNMALAKQNQKMTTSIFKTMKTHVPFLLTTLILGIAFSVLSIAP